MNIPTAELEAFATDEEKRPTNVLYRRDPTLDPQLVWKGKDEQDAEDLVVPAIPIHIQEQISPKALVEDLRQATDFARKMVCEWGMADSMGPVAYGQEEEPIFIGKEIARHKDYSAEDVKKLTSYNYVD